MTRKSAKQPPRKPALAWRLLRWVAVGGTGFAALGVVMLVLLAHDLPDIDHITPPVVENPVEIVARDGSLLARYGNARGDWLGYDQIPRTMIDAIIAIEDRRFFAHQGFDPRGMARALFSNLAGNSRQGGSTITQQLAKNLFLTPRQTLERKAKELLLALRLEQRYSKPDLISLYLNRVYFGAGTYGIDAASRVYFGHSARDLSLGEAALLAGLVKAPSRLAPTNDPDAAQARARLVLAAMRDAGLITDKEASAAAPARLRIKGDAPGSRWFTDWVLADARNKLGAINEPLLIRTSLDPKAQQAAQLAVRRLDQQGKAADAGQAALVALGLDGAVRAMVGGRDYYKSPFNRAVQARRQPGSAWKPFVYLAGFEAGLHPLSMMRDSPVSFDGWTPANFTGEYQGMVTLRTAFAHSINSIAVKLSEMVDRKKVIAMAQRLGIDSAITPHPSVALGTSLVTPLDLAGAYAVIANGGYQVTPYAIEEIRGSSSRLLYRRETPPPRRLLDPRTTAMITDVMIAAIEEGTGRAARPGRPAAGKTGTSQNFRDAWFLGFTASLVAGVWVGNDDNSAMRHVTGGGLPALIWGDFMRVALADVPSRPLGPSDWQDVEWPVRSADAATPLRSLWQRLFGGRD